MFAVKLLNMYAMYIEKPWFLKCKLSLNLRFILRIVDVHIRVCTCMHTRRESVQFDDFLRALYVCICVCKAQNASSATGAIPPRKWSLSSRNYIRHLIFFFLQFQYHNAASLRYYFCNGKSSNGHFVSRTRD